MKRHADLRHRSSNSNRLLDNSITTFTKADPLTGRRRLTSRQGHGAPNPSWIPAGNEAARRMAALLGGTPGGSIGEPFNRPLTAHFIGGCAIGTSSETGVIDPFQRVFGHPGLHVVDGSTISAHLGVNPSLTFTAQSERAMACWPDKGEPDPRPTLGSAYSRVEPVIPRHLAVPDSAHAPDIGTGRAPFRESLIRGLRGCALRWTSTVDISALGGGTLSEKRCSTMPREVRDMVSWSQRGTIALVVAGVLAAASVGAAAANEPGSSGPGESSAGPLPESCLKPGQSVYAMSAAERRTCRVLSFPRVSSKQMTDGGHEYVYRVEGAKTVYYVPPASFNPQTAPLEELQRYGFKSRPAGESYASGSIHFLVPPKVMYVLPSPRATTRYSSNWAGYLETGYNYDESGSEWREPALGSTICSKHSVVFWVGIGGWNGHSRLAQDGTAKHTPGIANNSGWSEVLPAQQYIVPQNISAPNGSLFYADTTYAGNNDFYFTMQDYANGGRLYYSVHADGYYGGTAEQIAERPTTNGHLDNLSNFKQVTFLGSVVHKSTWTQGSPVKFIDEVSHEKVEMRAGGTDLAIVSNLNSQSNFTVDEKHCRP